MRQQIVYVGGSILGLLIFLGLMQLRIIKNNTNWYYNKLEPKKMHAAFELKSNTAILYCFR